MRKQVETRKIQGIKVNLKSLHQVGKSFDTPCSSNPLLHIFMLIITSSGSVNVCLSLRHHCSWNTGFYIWLIWMVFGFHLEFYEFHFQTPFFNWEKASQLNPT